MVRSDQCVNIGPKSRSGRRWVNKESPEKSKNPAQGTNVSIPGLEVLAPEFGINLCYRTNHRYHKKDRYFLMSS